MTKIHLSPRARGDLRAIKTYIALDLSNPKAAQDALARIAKRLQDLDLFPDIGAPLDLIIDIKTDYRFLVCDNYTVFYRHETEEIFIDRILYGKQDFIKVLFGFSEYQQ